MIIHVVQPEDTISSIANKYGVSEEQIIRDNEIKNPSVLAIGESIVIEFPKVIYTVKEGDILEEIAKVHGVSVMDLLRNNPFLSNREFIYPGDLIVISYMDEKVGRLSINGYAYPFIDLDILKKTLPFLTYLTIFNYLITEDGSLNDIEDTEIIETAKNYGVAPIMMASSFTIGKPLESEMAHKVINNTQMQDNFITSSLDRLKTKGYYALNISIPYIYPEDRILYLDFLKKISSNLKKEGFQLFVTVNLDEFERVTGIVPDDLDWSNITQMVDGVIIISYDWGTTIGTPGGLIITENLKSILDYYTSVIPPDKLTHGESIIGYLWKLPYEECSTVAQSISRDSAIELAKSVGATLYYHQNTRVAFFKYIDIDEYMAEVRGARSVSASLDIMKEYNITSYASWNIMLFTPQIWLVINPQYEIEKVL